MIDFTQILFDNFCHARFKCKISTDMEVCHSQTCRNGKNKGSLNENGGRNEKEQQKTGTGKWKAKSK
jgi:hypothetical protein